MTSDAPEFSSPACAMAEADHAYMGFASTQQLGDFLNEMLEAERAGARVTLESAKADDGPGKALLQSIHRDEARWCAMLMNQLEVLGVEPSANTGAFYEKAMGIASRTDRLAFLNRGQSWVVRKLRDMLPRVRDDALHRELTEMLASHESNIDRAKAHLANMLTSERL